VGAYSTIFSLVPDHDIGFTVLAAGAVPNAQVQPLKSIIAEIFVSIPISDYAKFDSLLCMMTKTL
jgi:hypothetical protein